MISRTRYLVASILCVSLTCSALGSQPKKFLVVEPSIDKQWIQAHGFEYHYVWQSQNDGRNAQFWKQYSPDTLLSSYFPYMRDPTGKTKDEWLRAHPSWVLYRCDGEIALQFGNPIIPIDIANPDVRKWQTQLFLTSWQSDIGLDNFQLGDREKVCGTKSNNGDLSRNYEGVSGQKKFEEAKLIWLENISKSLHDAGKTITINYSLDVAADSEMAKRILHAVDGVLYEDYWGGKFTKGMFSSTTRMLELMKFFSNAQKENKTIYFIFQLPIVTKESIQTAMAAYLINSSSRSAVYISAVQRYGIVPNFYGYDKLVGNACGPATIKDGILLRRFEGADVLLHLPSAPPSFIHLDAKNYVDVDGKRFITEITLSHESGLIAYRIVKTKCDMPTVYF